MGETIYGIDLSEKITPIMVRDAIIRCFLQAHREVLDQMDEFAEWKNDEERDHMRSIEVKTIVQTAFRENDADFDNPTKEGLIKVIDHLAKFAAQFRKPEIIQKHYGEIKKLIDKLE